METPFHKKAIIIVEDNTAIADLIKEALNEEPAYQAVAVANAAQALELLPQVRVDLFLLDLNLPGLDGIQLYERLRQDPATQATPILFITANPRDARLDRLHTAGVIPKPFDLEHLLAQVAAALVGGE